VDLRQPGSDRLGERVGFGRNLLGGQRRHNQIVVLTDASQALARRVGEQSLQIRDGGVQFRLQPLQLPCRIGVGSGDGPEVVALRDPGLDGDEQRGRVGVAGRAGHHTLPERSRAPRTTR